MSEICESPRFSIVIPVYNGSDYLREAIDSALAQTYPSFEVIVVNDGSNDNGATEKIALSYRNAIRYFSKPNGGVASALNYAISLMKGEYFVWLSHDDLFDNDRLRRDAELLDSTNAIFITFCNTKNIDKNKVITGIKKFDVNEIRNPYECLKRGGINMCSMTINKHCFETSGLFNEDNMTMQDVEMNVKLSRHFIFYYNKNTYTLKRTHDGMGTKQLKKRHDLDQKNFLNLLRKKFTVHDFFPDLDITKNSELYKAHISLAFFYSGWGCYDSADYHFKEAYSVKNKFFSFPSLIKLFGSEYYFRKMNSSLIRKLIKKLLGVGFNYTEIVKYRM